MNKKQFYSALTSKKGATGFTLIESIIYMTAFVIVITLLTLFVFNLIKVQAKTRISKEVSENSQRAMEIMLWHIQHAQNVYESTSSFDSHPGQLSLETIQDASAEEEVIYLDFYLDENDRLCLKKEGTGAEVLVSENIKINNLTFNYLTTSSSKSIRIELSATYSQLTDKVAYQATTTLISSANLRND